MTARPQLIPDRQDLLGGLREARFPDGVACPRCDGRRVIRWGCFSGRQRYRCHECRRTFSDLTGTPAAYMKRPEALPEYRSCMQRHLSIRDSARVVGVHPSTAFRWRHRLLAYARVLDPTRVSGIVEIEEGWVRSGDPRPAGAGGQPRFRRSFAAGTSKRVWLVAVCDRRARSWMELTSYDRPFSGDIAAVLGDCVAGSAIVVSRFGRLSEHARGAADAGLRFRCAHGQTRGADVPLVHIGRARRLLVQFRRWLRAFRGVKPRYLRNYIAWRDLTDGSRSGRHIDQLLAWPLLPPRDPRPTNISRERTSMGGEEKKAINPELAAAAATAPSRGQTSDQASNAVGPKPPL